MLNTERGSVVVLKKICEEMDIKLKSYSDDWIFLLKKNNKQMLIYGYDYSLNTDAQNQIMKDKAALSELLIDNGISCIEHTYIPKEALHSYMGKNEKYYDDLIEEIVQKNAEVVIKPNKGTSGKGIEKATTFSEAKKIVSNIHSYDDACISPFYEINHEYRIITLDGKIILSYEKITDQWIKNLSKGAKVKIVKKDDIEIGIIELIEKTYEVLNARIMAFDIVQIEEEYKILEINGGLMMDNLFKLDSYKECVKKIYKSVIKDRLY